MSQLPRAWVVCAICALACGNEAAPNDPGGSAGNKGREAAEAALLTADVLHQIRGMHA